MKKKKYQYWVNSFHLMFYQSIYDRELCRNFYCRYPLSNEAHFFEGETKEFLFIYSYHLFLSCLFVCSPYVRAEITVLIFLFILLAICVLLLLFIVSFVLLLRFFLSVVSCWFLIWGFIVYWLCCCLFVCDFWGVDSSKQK